MPPSAQYQWFRDVPPDQRPSQELEIWQPRFEEILRLSIPFTKLKIFRNSWSGWVMPPAAWHQSVLEAPPSPAEARDSTTQVWGESLVYPFQKVDISGNTQGAAKALLRHSFKLEHHEDLSFVSHKRPQKSDFWSNKNHPKPDTENSPWSCFFGSIFGAKNESDTAT